MLLKDKVAVITGGAGPNGLGFATARQMAAQGARVVILDLARAEPAGRRRQAGRRPPGPGGRRHRQGVLRSRRRRRC
jgi:NAD(P)-dependent dehydrogenase (short-subunit alcohol dehydrogenase family)